MTGNKEVKFRATGAAAKKALSFVRDPKAHRLAIVTQGSNGMLQSMSQTEYWSRFGVTQSTASRYESTSATLNNGVLHSDMGTAKFRRMPDSLKILLICYYTGVIDDEVLEDVGQFMRKHGLLKTQQREEPLLGLNTNVKLNG